MLTYTLAIYVTTCSANVSGAPNCLVKGESESIRGYPNLSACHNARDHLADSLRDSPVEYKYLCIPSPAAEVTLASP